MPAGNEDSEQLERELDELIRFASNLQRSRRGESLTTGYLKVKEITDAERKWIISVQRTLESKSKQLNRTLGLYLQKCIGGNVRYCIRAYNLQWRAALDNYGNYVNYVITSVANMAQLC